MKLKAYYNFLWLFLCLLLNFFIFQADATSVHERIKGHMSIKAKHRSRSHQNYADLKEQKLKFLETSLFSTSSKKRWTKDNRLCANAFVQDGKTYTDCATTLTPDKQVTGQEWCYVDPNSGGSPKWAFCKPILDYDQVRLKAKQLITEITVEIRKVASLVYDQIAPAAKTVSLVDGLEKRQSEIDLRATNIENEVKILVKSFDYLDQIKLKWEEIDKDIEALERRVDELEESEQNGDNQKNTKNCDGLNGYESEAMGDGLKGSYFNNEEFLGTAVQRIDENVNFAWDNESPAPGINYENFAVKWNGYLRVPKKGRYTFYTECDDGTSISLNGNIVISHFMGKGKSWLDSSNDNYRINFKAGTKEKNIDASNVKAQSFPVLLNGGEKYKLEINMYHSVHNEKNEDGKSFIRTYWESDELKEQTINDEFLYSEYKMSPVKIGGINPETMRLATAKENDNAFIDSEAYKIVDLPPSFQDIAMIKFKEKIVESSISLQTSAPVLIFIGVDSTKMNPLSEDFEYSQKYFSMLQVSKKDDSQAVAASAGEIKRVKASASILYKVYEKKFNKGKINIPLTQTISQTNDKTKKDLSGVGIVLFYTMDATAPRPKSCAGKEEIVSNPNSQAFLSCAASSTFSKEFYTCEAGFSGLMNNKQEGVWATAGKGRGSWIMLKLKTEHEITKLIVKNRDNPGERNSKLIVTFSENENGDSRILNLKNTDEKQEFAIQPSVITDTIKITIKDVYGTLNNGGAFDIYGINCVDTASLESQDGQPQSKSETLKNKIVSLGCSDNLSGNVDLAKLGLTIGDKINIECQESCASSTSLIYGDKMYSQDSAICKSAYHAGSLPNSGGKFRLILDKGLPNYPSATKNGIQSLSKSGTSISIRFESKNQMNDQKLKLGMRLDCFETKAKKWTPCTLEKIEKNSKTSISLSIKKEGQDAAGLETISWPNNEIIAYCGEKLTDRKDCDPESLSENKSPTSNIRIAFGAEPFRVPGYLLDSGSKIGSTKGAIQYGWSRDLTTMARRRNVNIDPLLDGVILFPPAIKSKWCEGDNPSVSCEIAEWTIKLPNGKYTVKLSVGDPSFESKYDIQLNGKSIISRYLEKNQYFTATESLIVNEGHVRITAECEEDCKFSWSRINTVEINKDEPASDQKNDDQKTSDKTERLGCGLAFKGGRCNEEGSIENCLYDSLNEKAIAGCAGLLEIVKIPETYQCKEQVHKYKCIKIVYPKDAECIDACPGKCFNKKCLILPSATTRPG